MNPSRRSENTFFVALAIGMGLAVALGFSRTFFLKPLFPDAQHLAAPEPIFFVHGALFATWILLLVIQPTLVRVGSVKIHRRVGALGGVLAATMVLIGTWGSLIAAQRPGGFIGIPMPPLQFLAVPFFDMVLFALMVGLAIAWRRDSQTHKRLMMIATVNLLEAAIVRIPLKFIADGAPFTSFALSDVFIVLIGIWDLSTRGRIHPVTLWAGALTIISQPVRLLISGTEPWLAFAGWLVGLSG
jgi:uncharacterized membrane protein YozB (DUF420 family)